MALREFKLPDVGEGVAEGEIVQWLVEPGDAVTEDQPVAEVETDKALVEVPSPYDGTVKEFHAEEGEMVPVGTVIVTFEIEGDEAEAEMEPEAGEKAAEAESAPADVEGDGETAVPEGRVFAPPSVRRLARELDVDLASVEGSGPGGRVTEGDVRAAAEDGEPAGEPAPAPDEGGAATETAPEAGGGPATGAASVESADRDRTLAAPATRRVAAQQGVDIDAVPAVEERDGDAFVTAEAVREYAEAQQRAQTADTAAVGREAPAEREEVVEYRGVRKTIGEAMERSMFTAPHVTHHDTVDVTALVEAREELKPVAEERGVKLTYMPFVMKALVAALREFPFLNATLDEDSEEVRLKHYYNVGIAVATDVGLMVPVVDDVDRKGMLQLASEVNEKAQKARERTVSPDELRGSTISVTNFGAIGGEYATPIINYPEVAIVGLGELKRRPTVVEREAEDGTVDAEVEARWTLPLSISADHRVVDGADVAGFANSMMRYLNNPNLLLLE